jgi:hypothetical protein
MNRHARALAALGGIAAALCFPRPGAAFGLDLACGLLFYPVPRDSAYVQAVGCPAAWTGAAVGFAAAAPVAAVLAPVPVVSGDGMEERFVEGAGGVAFLAAHATGGALLLPVYVPLWLVRDPAW